MSLIPANIEYLAFAIQSDKDTAAETPVIAVVLEDCTLDPNPTDIPTPETDASAQQPTLVRVGAEPGGTFRKYVRPSEEDFFLYALLGATSDGGTTPKTHNINIDPSDPFNSPYLTVWDVWPGVACVKYTGVRIGQAVYSSQPGQAVDAEYTLVALKATVGEDEPDVEGLLADELPYSWANFRATVGELDSGIVNSFQITLNRNTTRFSGDNGLGSLDVPNGLAAVNGNLEISYQNDDLSRAVATGATDGTDLTDAIYDTDLTLDLTRGTGPDSEVELSMAAVQLSNLRTPAKTDGSPAVTTFDFNGKRQADISDLIAAFVQNDITHADRTT